jgi:hypothetical protein
VLVPLGHQYNEFVSDLAGFDPEHHDSTARTVTKAVVKWLSTRVDAPDVNETLDPSRILAALIDFEEEFALLNHAWHGSVPWPKLLNCAHEHSKQLFV